MRLVTFQDGGSRPRVGVELSEGGDIVDLGASDPRIPGDMRTFLEGGEELMSVARRVCTSADRCVLGRDEITLRAPIGDPDKIICAFNNHRGHCLEQGLPLPAEPQFFHKFASCIVGPGEAIRYPGDGVTETMGWEVELGVVIGKTCRNVKKADVHNYVAGFTAANDVTARDWEKSKNLGQMFLGKGMDTFCPLGPAIVTVDELPVAASHSVGLRCRVNGKTMQNGSTDEHIFNTEDIVSFLSRHLTLLPGDVILTGTPPGVGHYGSHGAQQYLVSGDVVETEIDVIGTLSNPVA